MPRLHSPLLSVENAESSLFRLAVLSFLAGVVFLCIAVSVTSGSSSIKTLLEAKQQRKAMLYWNDYEYIPPYHGEVSYFHDGWNQRV